MPIDASIYNALGVRPKSMMDYSNEYAQQDLHQQQVQQNALALQSGQMGLQEKQRAIQEQNALRGYMGGGANLGTPEGQAGLYQAAPGLAGGVLKDFGARQKEDAETKAKQFQTAKEQLQLVADVTGAARDQASYTQGRALLQSRGIDVSTIPEQYDPAYVAQHNQWAQTAVQRLDRELKLGDQAEAGRHNRAGEDAVVRGQDLVYKAAREGHAVSRANNADTIAKDFKVAGFDPATGSFTGGDAGGVAGLVDAIGTGKVAQNAALSRMPPAMKSQVLAQVAQKYPDYDPTDMAQRNRAAVAFGTGKEGASVRSFNVSLSHLDTLSNLADALHNGNTQMLNKVGNLYTQQTGSPAPTNFEAAKKIVTDEIVKAIVGSGGGVHDREAAAETISKASSPAQLKGAIETYKELMRGQLGGLERQYKATTGRSDFQTKFLSPEAQGQAGGVNADLHSQADAILRGGK